MICSIMRRIIKRREMTKEEKEHYRQKFLSSTIQNDFMFCHVMQDEGICTRVLKILLKDFFEISSIKVSTSQKTIENHPELKFVRLDVLATDEEGNSYDIEMQVVNRKNIERRMRAYLGAVDMFKMESGLDYNSLTNTVIIFITLFDPFGEGLPFYFFEQHSFTFNKDVKMSDGTYKAVFNASAYEDVGEGELKELLKFFKTGEATGGVAKEMEMRVGKIKRDAMILAEFFSTCASMQDARRDGIDEGIEEGLQRGREEGLQRGLQKGREEGLQKGLQKGLQRGLQRGIRTTAKNFLALGLPIEKIAQATGLSIEEIEKL